MTVNRQTPAVLDLAHLDRQTMGDSGLRAEVMSLAATQFDQLVPQIVAADARERGEIAHRIKGAARSIGAFALAQAAEALEADPGSEAAVADIEACAVLLRQVLADAGGQGRDGSY